MREILLFDRLTNISKRNNIKKKTKKELCHKGEHLSINVSDLSSYGCPCVGRGQRGSFQINLNDPEDFCTFELKYIN